MWERLLEVLSQSQNWEPAASKANVDLFFVVRCNHSNLYSSLVCWCALFFANFIYLFLSFICCVYVCTFPINNGTIKFYFNHCIKLLWFCFLVCFDCALEHTQTHSNTAHIFARSVAYSPFVRNETYHSTVKITNNTKNHLSDQTNVLYPGGISIPQ